MTPEQEHHYLKGGKFKAKYVPVVTDDLAYDAQSTIGKTIVIWQNIIIAPLQGHYQDQHAFNCDEFRGWFPEEDVQDLEIIEEYKETAQGLPVHLFRLSLEENPGEEVLQQIWGNWRPKEYPFVDSRDFTAGSFANKEAAQKYALRMYPQFKIEYHLWTGREFDPTKLEWEVIHAPQ